MALTTWLLMVMTLGVIIWELLQGGWEVKSLYFSLVVATFGTTGLILIWRVPHNLVAWSYLGAGLLGGLYASSYEYAALAVTNTWPLAAQAAVFSDLVYFPWIMTMVSLPILLFPDGRIPGPRWKAVQWAVGAVGVLSVVAAFSSSGTNHEGFEGVTNPWYVESLGRLFDSSVWNFLAIGILLTALLGPPVALVFRFRRSEGVERLQLKWLALSASIAAIGLAVTYISGTEEGWVAVFTLIALLGIAAIPITTGLAIVRYRLYDIDRLISRTVVYGILVMLIAGAYAGVVFLTGRLLPYDDSISVALSTLAVAALFNPLRKRIQTIVDRRLYRASYDARTLTETLAARLQDETDPVTISSELLDVVDKTVKPAASGIWIRDLDT